MDDTITRTETNFSVSSPLSSSDIKHHTRTYKHITLSALAPRPFHRRNKGRGERRRSCSHPCRLSSGVLAQNPSLVRLQCRLFMLYLQTCMSARRRGSRTMWFPVTYCGKVSILLCMCRDDAQYEVVVTDIAVDNSPPPPLLPFPSHIARERYKTFGK